MHTPSIRAPRLLLIYPLVVALSGCATLPNGAAEHRASATAQRPSLRVVTAEEIGGFPGFASVEEVLLHFVPGIRLEHNADGGMSPQIAGMATTHGAAGPLFVINGVPTSRVYGSLGINPRDVARIEVVRDGGELAMYGTRGSAGVVLITLKK